MWNVFDAIILLTALGSWVTLVVAPDLDASPLTILRTIRLTRLSRLIRIFRLKAMRELNIMVRGLLAGFKTLFWAIVLLFTMVYIVSVFLVVTIGESDIEIIQQD